MKMGDIYTARDLVTQRAKLDNQRAYAEFGHFTVAMSGAFLGDQFVDAAKPAVVAVYNELIASIDAQLRALGVDIE